ncbi:hypothetical protein ABXV22_08265 [Vibrio rotiferianus]|jgi:hypothetical protein|uniref:hypothetical protein n=1 Tax=Vibrio rotiferianus TaxID=190895 RepID=UPI003397C6E8
MKEWLEYFSDEDGHWDILSESRLGELTEHKISKNGNEATICSRRKPGNVVSVSIISASREIDSVTGCIGLEKRYLIKVESLKDGWYLITPETYRSEEALKIASLFMDKNGDLAKKIWKMKKLGADCRKDKNYIRVDR